MKNKEVLYIRNMVCERCISAVENILSINDIEFSKISLGEVLLDNKLSKEKLNSLELALKNVGFELLDHTTPIITNQIKSAIIELFDELPVSEDFKLSAFITDKFPYDYSHISRLFSSHEKKTIEQYLIQLRIEKAKELLAYKRFNISEVAYTLGYASNAHFSRQFKKITGVSPSIYKSNPSTRKSFDGI